MSYVKGDPYWLTSATPERARAAARPSRRGRERSTGRKASGWNAPPAATRPTGGFWPKFRTK
jgi:hypothetical protein